MNQPPLDLNLKSTLPQLKWNLTRGPLKRAVVLQKNRCQVPCLFGRVYIPPQSAGARAQFTRSPCYFRLCRVMRDRRTSTGNLVALLSFASVGLPAPTPQGISKHRWPPQAHRRAPAQPMSRIFSSRTCKAFFTVLHKPTID